MAGSREKNWGKEKKFREGQAKQMLDTLFFDFIDLAKKLQPKIVIAENVKGILLGNAKKYVDKIHSEFYDAGYFSKHFLLNASKMGVPQRRERVFFIAIRQDLAKSLPNDIFGDFPILSLNFNERGIPFGEIEAENVIRSPLSNSYKSRWETTMVGHNPTTIKNNTFGFMYKTDKSQVVSTITSGGTICHYKFPVEISILEYILASTFPTDYNFLNQQVKYMVGMSVPPVMMAQIASQIYKQWLSKIKITKL
jgi:DNA (cytosine-5)-methyltransferase 1